MSKQGRAPKSKTKTKARTQGEGGASDILREQLRVLHEGGVSKSKDRARPSSALDTLRQQEKQTKKTTKTRNEAYLAGSPSSQGAADRALKLTRPPKPTGKARVKRVPPGKRVLGPGFLTRYGVTEPQ